MSLRVRLYTVDGCEVEPLDALAAAVDLRAELEETRARRTSGWLFNQPLPNGIVRVPVDGGPVLRGGFVP